MSTKFRRTISLLIVPVVVLGIALALLGRNQSIRLSAATAEVTVPPTAPEPQSLVSTPEATAQPITSASSSLVSTPEATAENSEFTYCPAQSGDYAVDQAVSFIKSQAQYFSNGSDSTSAVYRYYAALSALNYVQTLVSPMRYPDLVSAVGRTAVNSFGAEDYLSYRAGLCGDQIETYLALMHDLGIPARDNQFYWLDTLGDRESHITAEVQWDGAWHFFDVTWGMFAAPADKPMAVASLAQIQNDTGNQLTRFTNAAYEYLLFSQMQNYDEFQYLSMPSDNIDIVTDGSGTIRPYWVDNQITFANIPNYIGYTTSQSGNMGHLSDVIAVPSGTQSLDITMRAQACAGVGSLEVNDQNIPLTGETEKTVNVDTTNTSTVQLDVIRSGEKSCYVVFDQITANGAEETEATPEASDD